MEPIAALGRGGSQAGWYADISLFEASTLWLRVSGLFQLALAPDAEDSESERPVHGVMVLHAPVVVLALIS